MRSFTTVLATTAALGVASAVPALEDRATHCWEYWTCSSNGFRGCCSVDPCNLDWCPDEDASPAPTSTIASTAIPTVVATPTTTTSASATTSTAATPTPTDSRCRAYLPNLYTVKNYDATYYSSNTTTPLFLYQETDKHSNMQVMAFSNIPADAEDCQLQWTQPDSGTNFGYYNSGLMDVNELKTDGKKITDLLDKVTYNAVKGLVGESVGAADTTFWPELVGGPNEHGVGGVKSGCAANLNFLVKLAAKEEAAVVFEHGKQAGYYVSWKC